MVHGHTVRGVDIDSETRCAHYATNRDVIAIRFACCGDYYSCVECHEVVADHASAVWPADAGDVHAVLCGHCGRELTINDYLDSGDTCPTCGVAFNPGCRNHYHHYFDEALVNGN